MSQKKRLDLIQELHSEREQSLDLLERAGNCFEQLADSGYLDADAKRLWEEIRIYLRETP